MILRPTHNAVPDKVYVIINMGQSNAQGSAVKARLANTQFNYNGISTGYPTVRVAQAQYGTNPLVYRYYKPNPANTGMTIDIDRMALDIGSWVNYYDNSLGIHFGHVLSLSTKITDATGRKVYIIDCAVNGTSLISGAATGSPGTWNYTLRIAAIEYFLKRGIRDLRTLEPNKEIQLLTVDWWHGEQDAANGATTSAYQTAMLDFKAYIDAAINQTFNIKSHYVWNFVKISHNRNAAEALINTAFDNIVASVANCFAITVSSYPRRMDLTVAEASPITKASPNSVGSNDDEHGSYIMQLSAGELIYQNIVSLL